VWEEKPVAVKTWDSKLTKAWCKRRGDELAATGTGRAVAELVCIQQVMGHFSSCWTAEILAPEPLSSSVSCIIMPHSCVCLARWHTCAPFPCIHDAAHAGNTIDQHKATISEMDRKRRTRIEVVAQYSTELQARKN